MLLQEELKLKTINDNKQKIDDNVEATKTKMSGKLMNKATAGLEKGAEAMHSISSAISKFAKADSAMDIASGVLDLVGAMAVFLPPPASAITSIVTSVFGVFNGGGAPSVTDTIKAEFNDLKSYITTEFAKQKFYTESIVEEAFLNELLITAQALIFDLSTKFNFLHAYAGKNLSTEMIQQIRDELSILDYGKDTAKIRITFEDKCRQE